MIWYGSAMSQVLQCTQFDGFRLMRLPFGCVGVVDHLVDIGRAEILARIAEFFYAARVADVGIVNDQVRRLVFFVLGAGVVEVGELVEGQLAIAFGGAEQIGFIAAIRGQFAELLHVLVARSRGIAVAQAAAAGDLLQAGVDHAAPEAMLESLMKVADLPELVFDPADSTRR